MYPRIKLIRMKRRADRALIIQGKSPIVGVLWSSLHGGVLCHIQLMGIAISPSRQVDDRHLQECLSSSWLAPDLPKVDGEGRTDDPDCLGNVRYANPH